MEQSLSTLLCLCLILSASFLGTNSQGCAPLMLADLGSSSQLSTDGIVAQAFVTGGENKELPLVQIFNYTVVCEVAGSQLNTAIGVSVLVHYDCESSRDDLSECSSEVDEVIRQFQFSCSVMDEWTTTVAGTSLFVVSDSTSATLDTELDDMCSLCVDPDQIPSDPVTHCVDCHPDCNQGQMRCFGPNADQCCNFYQEGSCVDECNDGLVPDELFQCVCPGLPSPANGMISSSDGAIIGDTVSYSCNVGFVLTGPLTRICTLNGWNGTEPTCEAIQIAVGFILDSYTFDENAGLASIGVVSSEPILFHFLLTISGGPDDAQTSVVISGMTLEENITSLPATVMFEISNDEVALEDDEVYSLDLSTSDPRIVPGGNNELFASTQITIEDEDIVIVGFQSLRSELPPDYSSLESESATVLVANSNRVAVPFSVDVIGVPTSQEFVVQSAMPINQTVRFSTFPGVAPFIEVMISFINDDTALENDEILSLSIENPSDSRVQLGGELEFGGELLVSFHQSGDVVIIDDDQVVVGFVAPSYTFRENEEDASVSISWQPGQMLARAFSVRVLGQSTPQASVINSGPPLDEVISIEPSAIPFVDIPLNLIDDMAANEPGELYNFTLSNDLDPRVNIGDDLGFFLASAEVIIVDDDIGQLVCQTGQVRLVNGPTSRAGRVEVCVDDTWGTVCDDNWDVRDASVVCNQLAFPSEDAVPIFRAGFGQGSGLILLDEVNCGGNEEGLLDCPNDGVGVSDCSPAEDAGVICMDPVESVCDTGDVRLVGGSASNVGRVEVCFENVWGTVCDDNWDENDAGVVCQQLDFSESNAVALLGTGLSGQFGTATGPVLLTDVGCNGTEPGLLDCEHLIGSPRCSHEEDAGVICQNETASVCANGNVRLVGGSDSREGRVEVCANDIWGTVCDFDWDATDADVVCRQLELSDSGAIAYGGAFFGEGSGPVLLVGVSCNGSESGLLDCPSFGLGVSFCTHGQDAGVRCPDPSLILRNHTVIGDPLYTVPLLIDNNEERLCYEIHGSAGSNFNLISDNCVSVAASYTSVVLNSTGDPETLNVISTVGVRAVDTVNTCLDIAVEYGSCDVSVGGMKVERYQQNGISVRKLRDNSAVRISVPNCAETRLVMRVICQTIERVNMLKFVVTRGINLRESSHGLVGQLWNVPISASKFTGETRGLDSNTSNVYMITVQTPSGEEQRTFPSFLELQTWDGSNTPCFFAGNRQGGLVYEVPVEHDGVIEGSYRDYSVSDIFSPDFKFSHFEEEQCN